jgi:ribosome-associated translation inhibitor RaiA
LENNNIIGNKVVEIELIMPCDQIFAKNQFETFEAATDYAVEELRRQIKKLKKKKNGHQACLTLFPRLYSHFGYCFPILGILLHR